jgi:poly-gamma-glutamate synthesis protein (capsule biosynthesis protein)
VRGQLDEYRPSAFVGEVQALLGTLADRIAALTLDAFPTDAELQPLADAVARVQDAVPAEAFGEATQVLDDAAAWTAGPHHPGLASAKAVDRLLAEVRAARIAADTVVVFLHWGVEGDTCPSGDQEALARELVAAGADVIVGGHAHRLQGAGRKDGALVAYGLGNSVFYSTGGPSTDSGVLRVTVQGRRVLGYRWEPARLVDGVATELQGDEAAAAQAAWQSLRACTDLQP